MELPLASLVGSCGFRLGDSLSPFLFVVVMEALSKMMSAIVNMCLLSCFWLCLIFCLRMTH